MQQAGQSSSNRSTLRIGSCREDGSNKEVKNNTVVCGLEYWILSVLQEEDSSMLTAEAAGKLSFISVPLSAGDESHVSGQEQSVTHLQQSVSTLDRLDIQCLCLYGFYLLLYKLSRLENFLILFSVTS
ncbi:uncharacterized protein LOC131051665 isoform X3 [Cryptomeria japonica]|uniref:uncharacterized protein LOC131051665 isoform X3 n=1 Tax=Cryptomeria japonica TaxID=3369 RepID=UPI0027DA7542|nr:uncharacterized protein LOC131051665 isoform X3 [Cryptomeria japonica]